MYGQRSKILLSAVAVLRYPVNATLRYISSVCDVFSKRPVEDRGAAPLPPPPPPPPPQATALEKPGCGALPRLFRMLGKGFRAGRRRHSPVRRVPGFREQTQGHCGRRATPRNRDRNIPGQFVAARRHSSERSRGSNSSRRRRGARKFAGVMPRAAIAAFF